VLISEIRVEQLHDYGLAVTMHLEMKSALTQERENHLAALEAITVR